MPILVFLRKLLISSHSSFFLAFTGMICYSCDRHAVAYMLFFNIKKKEIQFLCPQGPQADFKLRKCSHMVLNNKALKLTFPQDWINRGNYLAVYKFYLYKIKFLL